MKHLLGLLAGTVVVMLVTGARGATAIVVIATALMAVDLVWSQRRGRATSRPR